MSEAAAGYRFLSGAEMAPRDILATYPGARFVARARLTVGSSGEVWGLVIRLASPDVSGDEVREVTTDDGRVLPASVAGDVHPTGEAAAVLAAAKYWELPPAYVKGLQGR
jgi:hypothetical protein